MGAGVYWSSKKYFLKFI